MELAFGKTRLRITFVCAVATVMLLVTGMRADNITLDFEGLPDSTQLTNQFSSLGITFANATVLSAGISLNELQFPPHSGTNVVSDDGSPITLTFSNPVFFLSGYFTYTRPLTINAFGSNGQLVASATSAFPANYMGSGKSPNDFLNITGQNIFRVTISADALGNSFVMDDLTFTAPEPSALLLVGAGCVVLGIIRPRIRRTL